VAPPSGPIKVAILAPLTGELAPWGASTRDGAVMAFEEFNAKGGVLGREIEWVLGDTQCDPQVGLDAAKKVIDEDQVRYIVGALSSRVSIPISEYANERSVLQISPISSAPRVTVDDQGRTKPFIFRACFTDPFQGAVMAQFARQNLGAQTAAVLMSTEGPYTMGLAESFRSAFEAVGGPVVVWETCAPGQTDFGPALAAVKSAGPDVFFMTVYGSQANLVGAQAKQHGITVTLLGIDGWHSPDLDPAAVDGGYFSTHFSVLDTRPVVQSFAARYRDLYGTVPDLFGALAYDAAQILLESIEAAGADNPYLVKDTMAAGEFDVVTGPIVFDQFHDPVKDAVILHIENGQIVFETSLCPSS
jgi:branched-chain amino acid transport system substrate-binding protein